MSNWKRISLELSHTWPGKMLLRFEAADGPAMMVEVDGDDLAMIGTLEGAVTRADRMAVAPHDGIGWQTYGGGVGGGGEFAGESAGPVVKPGG